MAVLAALKHEAGGLAHLEREFRRDQSIGAATNPVRTEIIAAHVTPDDYPRNAPYSGENAPTLSQVLMARVSGCYRAFAAKMASKNMMNDYRGILRQDGLTIC